MIKRVLKYFITYLSDQAGAVMVEMALVMIMFLALFTAVIDYGLLGGYTVMTEKAAHVGARLAIVRPPACTGVPLTHTRGTQTTDERNGTSCRVNNGTGTTCADPGPIRCTASAANPTANEIWTRIQPLMPSGTTIANLSFEYRFDSQLGFLGGPFTPMVTVEVTPPAYDFISPLGGFATALGSSGAVGWTGTSAYRAFSVTLPAEDLAQGTNG